MGWRASLSQQLHNSLSAWATTAGGWSTHHLLCTTGDWRFECMAGMNAATDTQFVTFMILQLISGLLCLNHHYVTSPSDSGLNHISCKGKSLEIFKCCHDEMLPRLWWETKAVDSDRKNVRTQTCSHWPVIGTRYGSLKRSRRRNAPQSGYH